MTSSALVCRTLVDGVPTLESRVDDLRAVLDAAGSERAALFGFSEGGPISVLFAASYPQRVSALILYGTLRGRVHRRQGVAGSGKKWIEFQARIRASIDHWGEGQTVDWAAPSLAAVRRYPQGRRRA